MVAEIITIGTEITTGSILNTNTKYLSSKFIELGIESYHHTTVDDNPDRLKAVISIALNRSDLIITTGGLGPTEDDLTKEVISNLLGLELIRDETMENRISNMFKSRGTNMTDNNKKQAIRPKGSEFITNDIGTAPGIYIDINDKKIIMLPGPPRELTIMFEKYVAPLIKEDFTIVTCSINIIGVGESLLESQLKEMDIYEDDMEIATFAKEGEVEIKVIGRGEDAVVIEDKMNRIIKKINNVFGEFIYGYNNTPIEEIILNLLKNSNLKLGICESCTGGLIISRLIRIPGASQVIDRGVITYSNESKVEELNVNESTLEQYGAVSKETAYEMAQGLKNKTNLDIVLSITGIAGPSGGTIEKPVGLVYICILSNDDYKVIECLFNGNRTLIQNRAATRALAELRKFLLNKPLTLE